MRSAGHCGIVRERYAVLLHCGIVRERCAVLLHCGIVRRGAQCCALCFYFGVLSCVKLRK